MRNTCGMCGINVRNVRNMWNMCGICMLKAIGSVQASHSLMLNTIGSTKEFIEINQVDKIMKEFPIFWFTHNETKIYPILKHVQIKLGKLGRIIFDQRVSFRLGFGYFPH